MACLDTKIPGSGPFGSISSKPPAVAFEVAQQSITVSVDSNKGDYGISKRLTGIAMLHIEVSAIVSGVAGKWDFDHRR